MNVTTSILKDVALEISKMAKGTVIKHENMAELVKEPYKTSKYYSRITTLKGMLKREYSIFLDIANEAGYVIVEANNAWKYIDGKIEKGKKLLNRRIGDSGYIDVNDMSEIARNEMFTGMQKYSALSILLNVGSKKRVTA